MVSFTAKFNESDNHFRNVYNMTSEYLNSVYELKRLAAATEALEGDTMLYIRNKAKTANDVSL